MARWSPEQVSRGLRLRFPDEPGRWVCAETIYLAVYRPDLGGLPASSRAGCCASGAAAASADGTRRRGGPGRSRA